MHKAVSRALWGAFFVGGLTVLGAGAAHAADTSGEDGTASGNQIGILGEVPVTIGGNAISILGDSESTGSTTATTGGDTSGSTSATSGDDAIVGGNQIIPDIVAPIVAGGNAISVLGDSSTEGTHTSAAAEGDTDDTTATTTGEDSIAGGNQVMPDADLPIVVGGNSISVIGDSSTEGTQTSAATDSSTDDTTATTTGEDGVASGNQVAPDVDAPITVTGNDISVIRDDSLMDGELLDGELLDEGLLGDGLLDDGLLDDGLLDDGLDTGLLEDGLLDGGLTDNPVVRIGIIDDLLLSDSLQSEILPARAVVPRMFSQPFITAPLISSPLVSNVGAEVLAPVAPSVAVGTDVTGADVSDGTSSALTPLVATAALTPGMMLAATGAEGLPLIGGMALLLGTGLGLVAVKRAGHTLN